MSNRLSVDSLPDHWNRTRCLHESPMGRDELCRIAQVIPATPGWRKAWVINCGQEPPWIEFDDILGWAVIESCGRDGRSVQIIEPLTAFGWEIDIPSGCGLLGILSPSKENWEAMMLECSAPPTGWDKLIAEFEREARAACQSLPPREACRQVFDRMNERTDQRWICEWLEATKMRSVPNA